MQVINLSGEFFTVTAYTDGTFQKRETIWKETEEDYRTTLMISSEDWIEVRFPKKNFEAWFNHSARLVRRIDIGGLLKTEISRGTGVTKNYVLVTSIRHWE